jgi:hypothetical protein
MTTKRTPTKWVGPEYHIRVTFRAPIDYVFAWCTDYTPKDAQLEGESYTRKVIERTKDQVIFEDLEETRTGWDWGRDVVTLRPPNRWHMEGVGKHRDVEADYRLKTLPEGRTELDLRWRRRPIGPEAAKLTKAQREASSLRAWKKFGAALERDYLAGRRPADANPPRR